MIGQTLSHYRITAALGAGGMGEVYRATDTKLGRDVAIKVLPAEVAQDPERLGRFKREAHLLASLNHPNIAAIHGLEEADAKPFLVLELVEGEDLKARLERGALPVDDALEIAQQIAQALEEAHNKGIVHRDLKPANVKLTPDGKVKVLDFGLAKAWAGDAGEGSSSSASMSQSPTLAHSGTAAGIILGTAAYMSPEQARGKAVDNRGDVWAFGVLLWEMLTGNALFAGDTVTDVIASVVKEEPDLNALPSATPRAVRRLLSRCLRKDPRKRLPDIGGARLELDDVLAGTVDDAVQPDVDEGRAATERRQRGRQRWAWGAAGLAIAGLAVALAVTHLSERPAPPRVHLTVETPEGFSSREWGDVPVPSPDGRHVAFTGLQDGTAQVWIRPLGAPEARPLAGTEGANFAFWSPDSAWIGFFTNSGLSKVRLAGGEVHRICALPRGSPVGGTWGENDIIVFSAGGMTADLFAVAAGGGEAQPLTTRDDAREETSYLWPQFLPGGQHLLFVVLSTQEENAGLHVVSLDAPEEKRRLLPGSARFAYSSGHLLSVRDGTLVARRFQTGGLQEAGEPVPVAHDVASWGGVAAWAWFGVSPTGVLAYREGAEGHVQLVWLDRKGARVGAVGEPGFYRQMALSPDGRRVALEVMDEEGTSLWVMDTSRGVASRVTIDPAEIMNAVWSPDGRELAFAREAADGLEIFRKGMHAGAAAVPLVESPGNDYPEDWSRDGTILLYVAGNALWAASPGSDEPPELVLDTPFALAEPRLSPDGRWLAYISNESGNWEVYVEPFRRPGERVRVSVEGGGQPKWRGDGKELFYRSLGGPLMAVAVREAAEGLEVGLPTELFEAGVALRPVSDTYAVSTDGQRFLVQVPVGEDVDKRVHVITNWTSLLE